MAFKIQLFSHAVQYITFLNRRPIRKRRRRRSKIMSHFTSVNLATAVTYKTLAVQDLRIAYREAGDPANPKLVLLHGFPASSHQYRNLIPSLADLFHVIAPDYPGFGDSEMADPVYYADSFEKISEVVESFLKQKGFDHFGLYVQDYGGPVGFRIV